MFITYNDLDTKCVVNIDYCYWTDTSDREETLGVFVSLSGVAFNFIMSKEDYTHISSNLIANGNAEIPDDCPVL